MDNGQVACKAFVYLLFQLEPAFVYITEPPTFLNLSMLRFHYTKKWSMNCALNRCRYLVKLFVDMI